MSDLLRHLCLAGALAFSTSAMAETFCWASGGSLCDGCDATATWKVVVASAPRPVVPGRPRSQPWCGVGFRSTGGVYKPARILAGPSLGVARAVSNGRVLYKSDRIGRDRMVVQFLWINPRDNREQTGRVTYDIEVVGQPL